MRLNPLDHIVRVSQTFYALVAVARVVETKNVISKFYRNQFLIQGLSDLARDEETGPQVWFQGWASDKKITFLKSRRRRPENRKSKILGISVKMNGLRRRRILLPIGSTDFYPWRISHFLSPSVKGSHFFAALPRTSDLGCSAKTFSCNFFELI